MSLPVRAAHKMMNFVPTSAPDQIMVPSSNLR
jgi:hypothetical protein